MSKDLSTQLPNPPELQPIPSTSAKIWRVASLILTVAGLALMGVGAWAFVQQQIEANKPPPARILEVSVADFEPAEAALPASSPQANPTAVVDSSAELQIVGGEDVAVEPAESLANESPTEAAISSQEEVAVEAEPEVALEEETASITKAKLLEESALGRETALSSEPAIEPPLSLADNPLLVFEEEENSAPPELELAVTEAEDSTDTAAATGQPLTRIVAESINLDANIIDVGWETVIQNGVSTNVWVVADYAAGWHRNSKLPGQGGNIVLSAHHNIKGETFRYTVDLEPGDIITLYDEAQSYDYVVEDKFIVKDKGEPEAVRRANAKWIGPFNEERLTLVTCWPYNNNTHRLIVIAKPVDKG